MTGAIVRFFQSLPAWATSPTLGFGVILLIGLTDTLTGPYMWWTFVYVLPVTFFSWCNTRTTSLGLAILAGLVSLYANQTWHLPERPEWIGYWNGSVTGITCLFIALTVSALRDAIRQRDFLTNVVSHDLKNVLTALGMNMELLSAVTPADDPRRKFVNASHTAMTRMQRMVDDLTLFVRKTTRLPLVEATTIDLSRLLSDLVAFYAATASRKQIALTTTGLESPVLVRADSERIAEVLDNLIGNALKFTPENGSIDLVLAQIDHAAEIRIGDSGPGIPPSHREHVFEPYWKGDTGQTGSGLGLYVSRAIVEQHGGRIWFEGPAPGTVTHVRLPLSAN